MGFATVNYTQCSSVVNVLVQWFSTFFVPRPIIAAHYKPTTLT